MSASINYHLEAGAEAPVVDGPWGSISGYPGALCLTIEPARAIGGATLKLFGSEEQLAAIAAAITAHLDAVKADAFVEAAQ